MTRPLAAYVPAVRTGQYVYVSGQLPIASGQLLATGKVGAEVDVEQAKRAGPGLRAERAGRGGIRGGRPERHPADRQGDRLRGQRARTSAARPQVINGASELLVEVLRARPDGTPAAPSAMAVLPLDTPVEVELIAEVR